MKFLRFAELKSERGIPFTRAHVDRLEKAGKFPKRLHLSSMTVVWATEEIDAYLAEKMAARAVTKEAA